MHPSALVLSAAFQVPFLWSRLWLLEVFIYFWNPTVIRPYSLTLYLLPTEERKGDLRGNRRQMGHPHGVRVQADHPEGRDVSVTCLAGLFLPGGQVLWKPAQKSQVPPGNYFTASPGVSQPAYCL